ncbi:MAG: hypothetical protein K2L55_05235 [Muribaculaceae bacterium]|nr:hypothetical protein [Muribaculaceae bacterium]
MRVFLFLMAIITSSMIGVFSQTSTPKRYTIRYEEKIRPVNTCFENQKLPAKVRRTSSNNGEIKLVYEGEFPDSMKVAITAAADLWEAKIPNKQPIYIGVRFDTLDPDVAMAAEVTYCQDYDVPNDLNGCPTALASQLSDTMLSDEYMLDGYIIFNADIAWNCSFTDNISSGYNLTTLALKGIARCLGFGSSVVEVGYDDFLFYMGNASYFDRLLYNNNSYLSDLTEGSCELADFVKSNNVFLDTPSKSYKIYAPEEYKPDMSLYYLDEENSLMSYSMGIGNYTLSIDEKTIDILRAIGWDLPTKGLKIISSDIEEDGIASSYKSHTFQLNTNNKAISNHKWRFYLKDKSEKFIEVSTGSTECFTINKIDSVANYFININGDLEGRIECDYIFNGEEYSAIPFTVSLELKPIIISIDNVSTIKQEDYSFLVTFTVKYSGADYIYVNVEEEYDSTLRSYRIDEPFIAHAKTGNISTLYYSWITIEIINQYGSSYKTLEFEPNYNLIRENKITAGLPEIQTTSIPIKKVQIFNVNGIMVFEGNPNEYSENYFSKGIYLKKEIRENGDSTISKFILL